MGNPRNRTRKKKRKGKNTREVSAAKIQRLVSESTGEVSSGSDRNRATNKLHKCLVLDCPKCCWSQKFNTSSYAKIDGKSRNNMEDHSVHQGNWKLLEY
eukprot:gene14947-6092_t